MQDAEPGDLYVDQSGQVFRVVGVFDQPSVVLERVDGGARDHLGVNQHTALNMTRVWRKPNPALALEELKKRGLIHEGACPW